MKLGTVVTEYLESWINGNISHVRQKMRNKSKMFALQMVEAFVHLYGYSYERALAEVKKMSE